MSRAVPTVYLRLRQQNGDGGQTTDFPTGMLQGQRVRELIKVACDKAAYYQETCDIAFTHTGDIPEDPENHKQFDHSAQTHDLCERIYGWWAERERGRYDRTQGIRL